MKFTATSDQFLSALSFCRTILRTGGAPILSNCLIFAEGGEVAISAHNQFSSKKSLIAAKVFESGSATLPLEQLHQIISGAMKGAAVNILVKERATITFGKSRYTLGTLPVADFPALLDLPVENPLSTRALELSNLFQRPAQLLLNDNSNPLFCGTLLHETDERISSLGSDGIRLLRPSIDFPMAGRPPISVHRETALEIARMGAERVWWNAQYIAASSGNNTLTALLLANAAYGDYSGNIPSTDCAPITFNRLELASALKRMSTIATHGSVVRLSWGASPRTALLQYTNQDGSEIISCQGENVDTGYTGFAPIRCGEIIELLKGESVKLYITAPMKPIRIVASDEPDTLAVIASCRVSP